MPIPMTCLLCAHRFEAEAPAGTGFVDCPACRVRVPVVRPAGDEEDLPVVEFADEDELPVVELAEEEIPVLLPAGPDYSRDIRAALGVLLRTDDDDHDWVIRQIVRAGVRDRRLAGRLYQLIPIAWARFVLMYMGVYCPPEYIVRDRRTGEGRLQRFDEDPLYQQIQEIASEEMSHASSRDAKRVMSRSPEYNAVTQAIAGGSNPGDLFLGPPILM